MPIGEPLAGRKRVCLQPASVAVYTTKGMDDYDEFGNYIGADLDSDSDDANSDAGRAAPSAVPQRQDATFDDAEGYAGQEEELEGMQVDGQPWPTHVCWTDGADKLGEQTYQHPTPSCPSLHLAKLLSRMLTYEREQFTR